MSLSDPPHATTSHPSIALALDLPTHDDAHVPGSAVDAALVLTCRHADVALGAIAVELVGLQVVWIKGEFTQTELVRVTVPLQGPGLPPSNACHPSPDRGYYPARRGTTTFSFSITLPSSLPSTLDHPAARTSYHFRASCHIEDTSALSRTRRVLVASRELLVVERPDLGDTGGLVGARPGVLDTREWTRHGGEEQGGGVVKAKMRGSGWATEGERAEVGVRVINESRHATGEPTVSLLGKIEGPGGVSVEQIHYVRRYQGELYCAAPGCESSFTLEVPLPTALRSVGTASSSTPDASTVTNASNDSDEATESKTNISNPCVSGIPSVRVSFSITLSIPILSTAPLPPSPLSPSLSLSLPTVPIPSSSPSQPSLDLSVPLLIVHPSALPPDLWLASAAQSAEARYRSSLDPTSDLTFPFSSTLSPKRSSDLDTGVTGFPRSKTEPAISYAPTAASGWAKSAVSAISAVSDLLLPFAQTPRPRRSLPRPPVQTRHSSVPTHSSSTNSLNAPPRSASGYTFPTFLIPPAPVPIPMARQPTLPLPLPPPILAYAPYGQPEFVVHSLTPMSPLSPTGPLSVSVPQPYHPIPTHHPQPHATHQPHHPQTHHHHHHHPHTHAHSHRHNDPPLSASPARFRPPPVPSPIQLPPSVAEIGHFSPPLHPTEPVPVPPAPRAVSDPTPVPHTPKQGTFGRSNPSQPSQPRYGQDEDVLSPKPVTLNEPDEESGSGTVRLSQATVRSLEMMVELSTTPPPPPKDTLTVQTSAPSPATDPSMSVVPRTPTRRRASVINIFNPPSSVPPLPINRTRPASMDATPMPGPTRTAQTQVRTTRTETRHPSSSAVSTRAGSMIIATPMGTPTPAGRRGKMMSRDLGPANELRELREAQERAQSKVRAWLANEKERVYKPPTEQTPRQSRPVLAVNTTAAPQPTRRRSSSANRDRSLWRGENVEAKVTTPVSAISPFSRSSVSPRKVVWPARAERSGSVDRTGGGGGFRGGEEARVYETQVNGDRGRLVDTQRGDAKGLGEENGVDKSGKGNGASGGQKRERRTSLLSVFRNGQARRDVAKPIDGNKSGVGGLGVGPGISPDPAPSGQGVDLGGPSVGRGRDDTRSRRASMPLLSRQGSKSPEKAGIGSGGGSRLGKGVGVTPGRLKELIARFEQA